jgi:hypothetical protein
MTFRVTSSNVLEVVRGLVDEIDVLKRQTGTVKQNTIRLGNWVLEAEADELVRMTNLVTGVVSYVGANEDVTIVDGGGGGAYVEIPPFSIGGLIRNSFGTVKLRTNSYVMPVDFTSKNLSATLVNLSGAGPRFRLYHNEASFYVSPVMTSHALNVAVDFTFAAGDTLYMEVDDDGGGFNAGLSVMLRL